MKNWDQIYKNEHQISNLFEIEVFRHNCNKVKPLEDVYFDFGIFFNSSELRTLEYSKIFKENTFENTLLIDFVNDTCPLKIENIEINKRYLETFTKSNFEQKSILNIFNYIDNINDIIDKIPKETFKVGAKCFIDITGIPLIYSVTLLRYLKLAFPSPDLYLLNVSAKYEDEDNKATPQFSDGLRENIYIPGYSGKPDFSKPWLYIFLLGFEGSRSFSIYKVNEPEFVEAIIAEPGYQNEYSRKAIEINNSFLMDAKIDEKNIIKIDAGDPIEVCKTINALYDKFKCKVNICLVPLGTKPHALGAGLSALIHKEIAIMYQVPISYSMNKTIAGNDMWIYLIK